MTTVSPVVPMLSEKLDTVIHHHQQHQSHHPSHQQSKAHRDRALPAPLTLNQQGESTAASVNGGDPQPQQPQQQQPQEARHPGQQTAGSHSQPPSTASSTGSSHSGDSLQHQQQQQQQQQAQQQQQQQLQLHHHHHPASTTSSLNGFYQAIQQRHSAGSEVLVVGGKDREESTNPTAVSLFSPWSNFTGAGTSNYPFPSPSLGFTLGDTFVPWTDAMVPSGLTPTLNGTMMDQPIPHHSSQSHHAGGGFRDDHPGFFKQEYMTGGNHHGMTFGGIAAAPSMDDQRQGSSSGDIRKESNASSLAGNAPGSVSRVDSSSSGASMASAQMDGNVRTPTPLFKMGNNESNGLSQGGHSFEPSASYFTYPRPGGGDPNLLSSSYQSSSSHGGEGSSRAPPMQSQQLFHLNQPFPPAYAQHHQYMSVPPALTQHPSQHHQHQHQQQQHQFPPHGGFLSTDRQNSRASTSSEFSSISPAMLNSRAPRASSPVSMFSDDALHPISAQTSPHSQPQSLPIHPGMQHANLKRGSASSMMTDADDLDGDDLDGDEADGVEKNGMMWGMPTAAYRSLSARERKRVRNRISARTFRARRKEHLSVLEQDLSDRNALLKASQDEIKQLRNENAELRRRLMLCENEHQ